jgi:hypothetical protein
VRLQGLVSAVRSLWSEKCSSEKAKNMNRIYIYLLCAIPGIFFIFFVASLLDSSILDILLSVLDFDGNDVGDYVLFAIIYSPFIFIGLILYELSKIARHRN